LTTIESSIANGKGTENARKKQKMHQKLIDQVKEYEAKIRSKKNEMAKICRENHSLMVQV